MSAKQCSFRLARAGCADSPITAQTPPPPHAPRAIDCSARSHASWHSPCTGTRCGFVAMPHLCSGGLARAGSLEAPRPRFISSTCDDTWQRACKLCCNCMQSVHFVHFVHFAPSSVTSSFTPNQVLRSFTHVCDARCAGPASSDWTETTGTHAKQTCEQGRSAGVYY